MDSKVRIDILKRSINAFTFLIRVVQRDFELNTTGKVHNFVVEVNSMTSGSH
jgi:hypothetical protein